MRKATLATLATIMALSLTPLTTNAASATIRDYDNSRDARNAGMGKFKTVDGNKCYYEYGKAVKNAWRRINGKDYYFTKNGSVATGLRRINGANYYFNSKGILAKNTWKTIKKKTYYFGKTGAAISNTIKTIKGKTYYFYKDGSIAKNAWKGNPRYYFGKDGAACKGMKKIKGKYYLFTTSGTLARSGLQKYKGKLFLVKNGVVQTGLTKYDHNYYCFTLKGAATGWKSVNGNKYFFKKDGTAYKGGTYTISGVKYSFDSKGRLKKKNSSSSNSNKETEVEETENTNKQRYHYEISQFNKDYDIYTDYATIFYVKTDINVDNMDENGYDWHDDPANLHRDDIQLIDVCHPSESTNINQSYYDVKNPISKYDGKEGIDNEWIKYKDGYLTAMCFKTPGTHKVKVIEYHGGISNANDWLYSEEYLTVTVKDWEDGVKTYMKDLCNKLTNPTMSDYDKMRTVERYIRESGEFKYYPMIYTNDKSDARVSESIHEIGLFTETKRIQCNTAAIMMKILADQLGIKSRITGENGAGWIHVWLEATIDNQVYTFDATPAYDYVKKSDIVYIN